MTAVRLRFVIAALAALGVGIAGYLTYVHYAGIEPICASGGGGCEKVQTSDQSELVGIPVALLGLLAYLVLVATAVIEHEVSRTLGALTALIGVGFSAYLTYASLFQIEATCQWCLASATVMVLLAPLTVWRMLRG